MKRRRTNCNRCLASHFATVESLEQRTLFSVDLADSVSLVAPSSGKVMTGGRLTFAVTVVNDGTSAAAGSLTTNLGLSRSSDGSSPISIGSVTHRVNLKAGAKATFRVTEKITGAVTPGTYFGVAVVDPGNTFAESDTTNNSGVSTNSVQVTPKYPVANGNWAGTATIAAGSGKGVSYGITFTISDEDQSDGAFLISGTDFFPGGITKAFAGSGKLTPAGTFNGSTGSHGHVIGKVSGSTITFKFVNKNNSGSGSATLQG